MNEELVAAIALTRIKRLSMRHALTLYREVGNARDIFEQLSSLSEKVPSVHTQMIEILKSGAADAFTRAKQEIAFCQEHAIACLCLNDEAYPLRLRQCEDAPLVLYFRGATNLNAAHIVSVVGTRHCTEYGKDLCAHLIADLARLCPDTLVISGLAYGVDIHAHRAALEVGLPTVAVMAHGLDRVYPYAHRDVAKQIIEQGGLLTEYMTGTNPDKGNFVRRNRIVAGLCDACLVVESARKGGAIITAGLAFDYNRQVYACPGRLTDEYSEGCNGLIRTNKASILMEMQDLVADLGWVTEQQRKDAAQQPLQTEMFPEVSPEEQQIISLLTASEGLQINLIALQTALPIAQVAALLFDMEMKGLVKLLPGGVYRLRSSFS